MDRESMKKLFEKVNEKGILLEAEEGRANYIIGEYVASFVFEQGMFYVSIIHELKKSPEDPELLNMLNQSVPFGNHTIEYDTNNGTIHRFRGFFPVKIISEKELSNPKVIDWIKDSLRRAEVAAAGGYRLLTQSYFGKNIHFEFLQYREWINFPDTFPEQFFKL